MLNTQTQLRRGHTQTSYDSYNLRAFVAKIIVAHHRAGLDELYKLVTELYKIVTEAMIDEMEREPSAARRETVERIKAQILLLALTMPNGKPMSDCTGQEMASFGAAYGRIAAKVGKAKTVGSVLSEEEVRKLVGAK